MQRIIFKQRPSSLNDWPMLSRITFMWKYAIQRSHQVWSLQSIIPWSSLSVKPYKAYQKESQGQDDRSTICMSTYSNLQRLIKTHQRFEEYRSKQMSPFYMANIQGNCAYKRPQVLCNYWIWRKSWSRSMWKRKKNWKGKTVKMLARTSQMKTKNK